MRVRLNLAMALVCGVTVVGPAAANPVIREATGASAAAIQAAVDAFRADIGGPNNGNAPGTQPGGRREINWDGGGAAATVTIDPSPMARFANRGAVFTTPGTGFEISGQPQPEFGEINAGYPALFAPFSSPRLFTALDSNVMDVWFFVPGSTTEPAAVSGFGAVFTSVSVDGSTRMEFYAPDGALLYERAVPYAAGAEYLSFLGVSFDQGEVIGRVRIVSGNAAPGPDETTARDLAVMDDFIYGEPVKSGGLTLTPGSGRVFQTGRFDLVIGVSDLQGTVVGGRVALDGVAVTAAFLGCMVPGTIVTNGYTFRCPIPPGALAPGAHVLMVELDLSNQTRLRNAVRWTVVANTEP